SNLSQAVREISPHLPDYRGAQMDLGPPGYVESADHRSEGPLRVPEIATLAGRPYPLVGADGTSAASPLSAGMTEVPDGNPVFRHLKPVGPLNPLLYRIARQLADYRREVLHDGVRGNNDILDSGCCPREEGAVTKPTASIPELQAGRRFLMPGSLADQGQEVALTKPDRQQRCQTLASINGVR